MKDGQKTDPSGRPVSPAPESSSLPAPSNILHRFAKWLDSYFGLTKQGSCLRTELVAGLTTFLTMAYIVFVNPTILANSGMDKGAVFVATCLASAVSTLVMAF